MVNIPDAASDGSLNHNPVRQTTAGLMRQPPAADVPIEISSHSLEPASLTFQNLTFSAVLPGGEKKTILEPCSGHIEPGQLTAVMGPSGCGKSTLVDMLAMKKTAPYSGDVLVNGQARDPALFPRIAAYVGQEDFMPAHWKVREALEFNASLKWSPTDVHGTSRLKLRQNYIDGLLEAFGLSGVANTYIGGAEVRGISGGQRRRVTLARGVAAHASLLFCDEPTSGLSATDAELCVKALRVIAKRLNVLVVIVIHQPRVEVAQLFDNLILLTANPGRMAYQGSMSEAALYMKNCGYEVPGHANPTDYYLDLLTPGAVLDASEELVQAFKERQEPDIFDLVKSAMNTRGQTAGEMLQTAQRKGDGEGGERKMRLGRYAVPFRTQFVTLLRRKIATTFRNPAAVGMQLAMPAVMGCVLGAVFQGIGKHDFGIPQLQFVFILLTMLSLQSLPLMPVLIEERVYMKNETSERLYTEAAHILSTVCVTVPLSLIGAAIQTLIIYAFSGLPLEYLPTILGWTLLLFFLFDALFQCVAAIAPDGEQAMTMATPFLVIFMLFNGVVVTKATAPVFLKWIFTISPTMYALQAIVLRMGQDAGPAGKLVISTLNYEEGENVQGIIVITCMAVALRVLQVFALKCLNGVQR